MIETIEKIKNLIAAGKTVHWSNRNYKVIQNKAGELLITCIPNGHTVGLSDKCKMDSFFVLPELSEESAKRIQSFGEQSPYFHDGEMVMWRRIWKIENNS